MESIQYEKRITATDKYDIVVCGGGPAGSGAAVAAAEQGMKTVLIERYGFLGGMATAGYVNPMSEFCYNGRRVSGGIPWRFAQALVAVGGGKLEEPRCNLSFNPEAYKVTAMEMVESSGVELRMNTRLVDCLCDHGNITAAIISDRDGMQAVRGRYFIDATGDAELSYMAGAKMLPESRPLQPGTLCFMMADVDTSTERMHIIHQKNHRFNHQAMFIREPLLALREQGVDVPQFGGPWLADTCEDGCITVNMTRSPMDARDREDYNRSETQMHRDALRLAGLLKEHVPEFAHAKIVSTAVMAGIRQSRRVKGIHVLNGEEYIHAVRFPDAVARSSHAVDIHLPDGEGQVLSFPDDAGYIPFRCLINDTHRNLFFAGRAISADEDAFAATRVQGPCMETGQAAGLAAAVCLLYGGMPVQETPVDKLLEKVHEYGSCIESNP